MFSLCRPRRTHEKWFHTSMHPEAIKLLYEELPTSLTLVFILPWGPEAQIPGYSNFKNPG